MCLLLIILGSCPLSQCLQKLNACVSYYVERALGSFGSISPISLSPVVVPISDMVLHRWHLRMGNQMLPSAFGILPHWCFSAGLGGLPKNREPPEWPSMSTFPTSPLPQTKVRLATLWAPNFQQLPWRQSHIKNHFLLDLTPVYLQSISLARTWSSCFFSTDLFLEANY